MAYETEKARLAQMIEDATGIPRTWNKDLEREADERAYEAFLEVGTGPQPDGTYKGISHPTQMERESRLGPEWAGKGVAEIAIWFFDVLDPVKWAADGWMNSAAHRAVLVDPRFKHIGIGTYTHLPAGAQEYQRRWYFIAWLAINIPIAAPTPPEEDMILVPTTVFPKGTVARLTAGVTYNLYRPVSGKLERKDISVTSTTDLPVGCRTSLNGDMQYQGAYVVGGTHAGWVISGWTMPTIVFPPDHTITINELKRRIAAKNAKADELKAI